MNGRIVALGVAMAALVGVVAASRPEVKAMFVGAANLVGVSLTPANSNSETGPSYLIANQPWIFGTPSSAVLPSVAQKTVGGSNGFISMFDPLMKTFG